MKTRAIFIMAYSRPRYLYVCLDSLKRCTDLTSWDIWVSFDSGPAAADHAICTELLSFYALKSPVALGNRDHPTEMLRCARYFGYERILFVEDDMLFSPGLLAWAREVEEGWTGPISAHCLETGRLVEQTAHMSSAPCSLSAAHADALIAFMDTHAYLGLDNVCINSPITSDPGITYDVCWYAWCIATATLCRFAPRQLSFNFGFNGMHFHNDRFDSAAFRGPRSSWLANVLALSQDAEFAKLTRTPGFAFEPF